MRAPLAAIASEFGTGALRGWSAVAILMGCSRLLLPKGFDKYA
jgi:hypothetical protein